MELRDYEVEWLAMRFARYDNPGSSTPEELWRSVSERFRRRYRMNVVEFSRLLSTVVEPGWDEAHSRRRQIEEQILDLLASGASVEEQVIASRIGCERAEVHERLMFLGSADKVGYFGGDRWALLGQ